MKLIINVAALLISAAAFSDVNEFRDEPTKYWDFGKLQSAPKYRDCPYPDSEYPGMRPILVEGFGPNGTAAEFFCYYVPAALEGDVVKATLPKGAYQAFLSLYEKDRGKFNDLCGSSSLWQAGPTN